MQGKKYYIIILNKAQTTHRVSPLAEVDGAAPEVEADGALEGLPDRLGVHPGAPRLVEGFGHLLAGLRRGTLRLHRLVTEA